MSISWGWKIFVVYAGFAAMIIMLVLASSRQKFDLVSDNYYRDEIAYQEVIDASKNQSALSGNISVGIRDGYVEIIFPSEFKDGVLTGNIRFYSAIDKKWDRTFKINASNNTVTIPLSQLAAVDYTVKINYSTGGKNYYYESYLKPRP